MQSAANGTTVHIRGVHPDDWKAIRLEAVQRGISVAQLLAVMWHDWAKDHAITLIPRA